VGGGSDQIQQKIQGKSSHAIFAELLQIKINLFKLKHKYYFAFFLCVFNVIL